MENNINPSGRVVIIGAGMVGSTSAYSLLLNEVAKEVLIIDIADKLAEAQVLDLEDAAAFIPGVCIKLADYSDLRDGDIIVITAGAAQKEGESRTELLSKNKHICKSIIDQINNQHKELFVVIVSNPVDVLTYVAKKNLNQPDNRVFGSGTVLDTARLRNAIGEAIDVSPTTVHAYTIGEHGDTSFPVISDAEVSGIQLSDISEAANLNTKVLLHEVRQKAYKIIEGKSATYFGIGMVVSKICSAILKNEDSMLSLSVDPKGSYGLEDLCIGLPVKLSSKGYELIGEIELDDSESEKLLQSSNVIKENIISLDL